MYDEVLHQMCHGSSFICVMEVRVYVPWKFVYMCHGSSFICAMEVHLYVLWSLVHCMEVVV